jgi:NhaP-type Na+/H+ and K+/H+ antiporter
MDKETWMLGIIVPLISTVVGGCISLLIMRKLLKEERVKSKIERAIDINNDKIKNYKELFELNKKIKIFGDKIRNNTIPNWINVESYYRDEFIIEFEEVLNSYKFVNGYINEKKINEYTQNVLKLSQAIIVELKDRENYGTTSEKVESCVDALIEVLNTIEKNILLIVLELSKEKYK